MEGIITYEIHRLKSRHFWLIPGLIFFLFYIYILPLLIWPIYLYLKSHYSDTFICVVTLTTVHHISFGIYTFVLYIVSNLKLPFFEQYRLDTAWPTELFPRAAKTLALNFIIIVPLLEYVFTITGSIKSRLDFQYPEPFEVFTQIVISMIFEDIWSYFGHRSMHTPYLYSRIHKKHHEYTKSISYSAEYAHPIEYFMVNILAVGIGPIVLGSRMHLVSYLAWISYRTGDTLDQHSGYDFPWNPWSIFPFATSAHFHDEHHTKNVGSYGSQFVILDFLLGTMTKPSKKRVD